MTNYTMDTYEIKREIKNFAEKMTRGLNKPVKKFVLDMQYGISKSKSLLISEISRALDENIKLSNTIERLCENLSNLTEKEHNKILSNYQEEIKQYFPKESIAIFDDSDIAKRYGKKFEDLDRVRDASSESGEIVNGYNVCEAVILTKNEKQPVSVYSKIYSCKSAGFRSKNNYTMESIETVRKVLNRKCMMVFDRGYDDNKIINLITEKEDYFVIRMNEKRNFLFKGRRKNCHEIAVKRKGKVLMKLQFEDEILDVYLSHTKVTLPHNKCEYELVIVYGLSEENPMILLTNREIKSKEDLIKVVRMYMYRWRVEEYFRTKKSEYGFEKMRVRNLKSMNSLNLMLSMHMGHLSELGEKINSKLLSIKIIERSKSLRSRVCLWLNQLAKGIKEILSHAKCGIIEYKNIESREKNKQLELLL